MLDLIDIIIPTKDRSKMLLRSISSILNNSKTPTKIIVVDSSSETDLKTKSIIENLCKKRSINIDYVVFKKRGLGRARNKALSLSKARIVGFLDDDEIVPKHWITTVISFFKNHPDSVAIWGPRRPLYANNYWNQIWDAIIHKDINTFSGSSFSPSDNTFYKRDYLDAYKIRYDERLPFAYEDFALSEQIKKSNHHKDYLKNLYVYHEFRTTLKDFVKQWYLYGAGANQYDILYNSSLNDKKYYLKTLFARFHSLLWLWEDVTRLGIKLAPGLILRNFVFLSGYITSYTRYFLAKNKDFYI
jgi:glycosyltransferase involved in cell wall biosynthesis